MKRLIARLRSSVGETLVESMVAILVFALSSLLLYSMITAANEINRITQKSDLERQEQLSIAEAGNETRPSSVDLSVRSTKSGGSTFEPEASYTVHIAQKETAEGESTALYSYFRSN